MGRRLRVGIYELRYIKRNMIKKLLRVSGLSLIGFSKGSRIAFEPDIRVLTEPDIRLDVNIR